MWFEGILSTDVLNPHYKYLWLPNTGGRHYGIVVCDKKNETRHFNIGPEGTPIEKVDF